MSYTYSLSVKNDTGVTTPTTWTYCIKDANGMIDCGADPRIYKSGDSVTLQSSTPGQGVINLTRGDQVCVFPYSNLISPKTWTLTSNTAWDGVSCESVFSNQGPSPPLPLKP